MSMVPWNPDIIEHMTALRNEYRKIISIVGDNYSGRWDKTRTACRGIVIREGRLLLSYENNTGQWMLPGGGREAGEDEHECCIREIAEETGYQIRVSDCVLEIDEYYEDFKWVNRYFFGEITGETAISLTEREKEAGTEPRWLPLDKIINIFSRHALYADTDEMRRGIYLREYTALSKLCGGSAAGKQVILLNGPSSSGKSTLSKALQTLIRDKLSERYEVISIDDFMTGSPMETIYEDDVFAISGDLCERALEILRTGTGVIMDHVITSERIFKQLKETLYAYPLRLIHVKCPLRILRKREQLRGDRCPGSAESSAEFLFPKTGYDLTVDTGKGSPAENALLIFKKAFEDDC